MRRSRRRRVIHGVVEGERRSPHRLVRMIAPLTVLLFLALQGADATLPIAWGVLALGACGAALCGMLDLQRRMSAIEHALLAVLFACALSVAFGVDRQHSMLLSVPTLASVLLWILSARAREAPDMYRHIALGLGAAAAIQIALLLLAASRHPGMTPAQWVADAGAAWLVVPNDIAWIACVLPLLAALATRRRFLVVLGLLLICYLGVCALAQSRSAALTAVAVAVLAAAGPWFVARRVRWLWLVALAAAGAIAGFAFLALASMRARLQLWGVAWAIFRDHPWTGVGLHDFVIVYGHYVTTADLIDPRVTPWPHQLFLEIAAECGVIGILAALFLAAAILRRVLVRTPPVPLQRVVVPGLFGMLLLGLVEATLLRQWVWLLGTALCALLPPAGGVGDQGKQEHEERNDLGETASRQHLQSAGGR